MNNEVWLELVVEALATQLAIDASHFHGRLSAASALAIILQVCSTAEKKPVEEKKSTVAEKAPVEKKPKAEKKLPKDGASAGAGDKKKRKLPDGISKGVELLKSGLKIISDVLLEWQLNQFESNELYVKYSTQFS